MQIYYDGIKELIGQAQLIRMASELARAFGA
jgi:hypothetical protein